MYHYMDRHGWRFIGEYGSVDEALAGLQEELDNLD